ncbi:hypothetical protein [Borreliella americana]|nr:hypothetical protein [Borreliella americana]
MEVKDEFKNEIKKLDEKIEIKRIELFIKITEVKVNLVNQLRV